MMKLVGLSALLAATVSAQTEAPLYEFRFTKDRSIETADLNLASDAQSGAFEYQETKTFTAVGPADRIEGGELKFVDTDFNNAADLQSGFYEVVYDAGADGTWDQGNNRFTVGKFAGKFEDVAIIDNEVGVYDTETELSKLIEVDIGPTNAPLLRASKDETFIYTKAFTIEPDTLIDVSGIDASQAKSLVLGEDVLSLGKTANLLINNEALVDADNASIIGNIQASDSKTFGLAEGPIRINAAQTNQITNGSWNLEDLEGLRAWVESAEPVQLKTLILKSLNGPLV